MTTKGTRKSRGMPLAELLALPVAFPLDDANRAIDVGRSFGYAMAKAGTYPLPILKLGRAYRCRRSDLLTYLGISEPEPTPRQLVTEAPDQFERPRLRSV